MASKNIGKQLQRVAKREGISVIQIAAYTGATRCTVYNWMAGRTVSPAYRAAVQNIVDSYTPKEPS